MSLRPAQHLGYPIRPAERGQAQASLPTPDRSGTASWVETGRVRDFIHPGERPRRMMLDMTTSPTRQRLGVIVTLPRAPTR